MFEKNLTTKEISIDLLSPCDLWDETILLIQDKIAPLLFLTYQRSHKPSFIKEDHLIEVCITFTHNQQVQELNKTYRDKDKPTNVLSFPQYSVDDPFFNHAELKELNLGDVILAYEITQQEAQQQSKTMENHTLHLILHGFLHLLGYDHIEDGDAKIMEGLEIDILSQFGIPNPYDEELNIETMVF